MTGVEIAFYTLGWFLLGFWCGYDIGKKDERTRWENQRGTRS